MNNDITKIPDYAALKKLAAALWQQDNSYYGAAVMVGAGFSRIAASSGNPNKKLPLWGELSKLLAAEIGCDSQTDSLRLAEEYRAYFGQQALLDLLKKAIHDDSWIPGALHKDLLELPWSEVLTTNWDTLLERASRKVHQPVYSVVNRQEDLSSARAPRIVKLHGTIGITDELVFSQEDFRKFPQHNAAFVNFARQVFIENELCLLGFSGDDPNFLQWAGWVRDHLANHARRIYLVGALNLTAAKRRYLESINVAPIDLTLLVAEYDDPDAKHLAATKIFIEELQKLKPKQAWEWVPSSLHRVTHTVDEFTKVYQDAAYAAKLLESQIATLEADRLSYPGWLTCPPLMLHSLQSQICDPYPSVNNLAAMTANGRVKLLYEMAWRSEVTYQPLPPWVAQELLSICDPAKPCALTKQQQMEVALLLLKSSRWLDEPEAQSIAQTTTAILVKNAKHWPESANELTYHHAIIARDRFDFPGIERAILKLDTSDPIWKLRKASLLAELGRFNEGKNLIEEAHRELLDQHRKDRNSIHVLSRLAWAHWLMHGVDQWTPGKKFNAFPSIYQDPKCDPWVFIEHVKKRVSKTLENQREKQGIEPLFEPGSYKDHSNTITFKNEFHPFFLFDGLSLTVGIPLRWNMVSFLLDTAAVLIELDDLNDMQRFILAIRSANSESSDALKKVFSRIRVACFSEESVTWLFNSCGKAIEYWSAKLTRGTEDERRYALDRLRVFIEVLARISVRVTSEQAIEVLKKGLAFGQSPAFHHFWLFDALRDLMDNAIGSVPQEQQYTVLLEVLSFPLHSEIDVGDHQNNWPNPVIRFPGQRSSNAALDRRIDEIIDRIAPCSSHSAPALLRLLPLLDNDFLTETECKKIGEKIWGATPDYKTLPQTGLYPHVLLTLPAPDRIVVRDVLRRNLFDIDETRLFDRTFLASLTNVARTNKGGEYPSAEQAEAYWERLVSWRKIGDMLDPFEQVEQKSIGELIGSTLAHSVVPSLSPEDLNQQNFDKLLAFYSEVDAPEAIIALACFAASNESFVEEVAKLVRRGLQGQDVNKRIFSAFALLRWREKKNSPVTDKLTSQLIYLLEMNLGGGISALLWTARQMYVKSYLSVDDTILLRTAVSIVFDSADYKNPPSSQAAVSISLVRAECVKLAKAILDKCKDDDIELLRIIEEAKHDPLPEVRFSEIMDNLG